MGPGYFILAIMGCGDGAVDCQDLRRSHALYASEVACMADSETALYRASSEPYPLLLAECRRVSPQLAQGVDGRLGS